MKQCTHRCDVDVTLRLSCRLTSPVDLSTSLACNVASDSCIWSLKRSAGVAGRMQRRLGLTLGRISAMFDGRIGCSLLFTATWNDENDLVEEGRTSRCCNGASAGISRPPHSEWRPVGRSAYRVLAHAHRAAADGVTTECREILIERALAEGTA